MASTILHKPAVAAAILVQGSTQFFSKLIITLSAPDAAKDLMEVLTEKDAATGAI